MDKLIPMINKIQDIFNTLSIPDHKIPLPQIVMVGAQVRLKGFQWNFQLILIKKFRALANHPPSNLSFANLSFQEEVEL